MSHAYLSLGGNEGDVPGTFRKALQGLAREGVRIMQTSPLYRTEPWGMAGAAMFFNQAIQVETALTPHQLLGLIHTLESAAGRKRRPGVIDSRPLDVDILLYDERIVDTPDLQIPHPRMHERRFVLVPLADIAPDLLHPALKQTIADLLEVCNDPLLVERTAEGEE